MEHEDTRYEVVMDGGPDTEVLGRVRDLDLAAAVYMAAVAKHHNRNIQLRQGANIIKRHDGEPEPEPPEPVDPNMKSWSVHLIGGRKMQHLGNVRAIGEQDAIKVAAEKFGIDEIRRKRLAVTPAR